MEDLRNLVTGSGIIGDAY